MRDARPAHNAAGRVRAPSTPLRKDPDGPAVAKATCVPEAAAQGGAENAARTKTAAALLRLLPTRAGLRITGPEI